MSSLADYRRKRRFDETPEPGAGPQKTKGAGNRFVVQKHDAARTELSAPSLGQAPLSSKKAIEEELSTGKAENISVEIDGVELRLTHLNKVYFPESNYTKRDLLAYYFRIAKYILPFLKDRPLVLRRYPDGITAKAFFQKDAGESVPDWIKTAKVHSQGKDEDIHYFVANDLATLLYLTNFGCIDHNPWASRIDDLERPDYVFFDLDPSDGTEFTTVVEIAQAIHKKLVGCGLKVFLKTSGATGFHLFVPLKRQYTFEQVRMFAEIVGRLVAAEHPKKVTEQRIIAKRPRGTVMIDAYQNALTRPLAAPYAVRAFPQAPVSAPITPRELQLGLRPDRLNIKTIYSWIKIVGDLWAGFWDERQELTKAIEILEAQQQKTARIPSRPNRKASAARK